MKYELFHITNHFEILLQNFSFPIKNVENIQYIWSVLAEI